MCPSLRDRPEELYRFRQTLGMRVHDAFFVTRRTNITRIHFRIYRVHGRARSVGRIYSASDGGGADGGSHDVPWPGRLQTGNKRIAENRLSRGHRPVPG